MLLPLNGHTVVGEVLTRCQRIPGIDEVVCAVPNTDANDRLAEVAGEYATMFRGDEFNVLHRYFQAAAFTNADIIVRVTADCPLICPELCGAVWRRLEQESADYASNIEPRTFPQGLDCEAFTGKTLCNATLHGPDEHVTTWMRSSPEVRRAYVTNRWKIEGRMTLDTEDDYRTICAAFNDSDRYLHAA